MNDTIDYYLSLQSPWTYLGHQRLLDSAGKYSLQVMPWPVDFSQIFPATGGLALPKRSPQRQAYRLVELRRWSDILGLSIHLQPRYFPVDEKLAAGMVIALREQDPSKALALTGAILRAVWAEERDIADPVTLAAIASAQGLDGAELLEHADQPECQTRRDADSQAAIKKGVFGAPTYCYRNELFWGQDRLDFLERALEQAQEQA